MLTYDRDLEYGWMPAAARNILSDPDVEQFMRDAIYMLHREMSLLRKGKKDERPNTYDVC